MGAPASILPPTSRVRHCFTAISNSTWISVSRPCCVTHKHPALKRYMITDAGWKDSRTTMRSKGDRLVVAAACLVIVFSMRESLRAQSSGFSITLTGQSMIRSDIRAHAPAAVPVITSLLKGDVIFTNFESTIVDERKGQSHLDGRFLSPPEALDALKEFGFNLVSLSNNHAFDLKVPGIQNTLQEASRLNLAHAGTGNTIEEAAAPGYLHTPKGTVALVAMASGLVAEGGSPTTTRPGVNELRVEGTKPNEEDAQRILQSIRNARQRADLVIVYEHNHVFDKPFGPLM